MDAIKQKEVALTTESLRVRCPHCRKLYLVQRADIRETRPRFECVQCNERFWLSIEELDGASEVLGLPLQMRESPRPQRVEPCPKCRAPVNVGALECKSCGVVVAKWKEARSNKGGEIVHSENLNRLWQKVIDGFSHAGSHTDFIDACRKENNLPFAGQQYARLAQVIPGDDEVRKRLREIEALALVQMPLVEKKRFSPRMPRAWQIPLFLGTVMVVVGLFIPLFRNLAGVGAALFFVALFMRLRSN